MLISHVPANLPTRIMSGDKVEDAMLSSVMGKAGTKNAFCVIDCAGSCTLPCGLENTYRQS